MIAACHVLLLLFAPLQQGTPDAAALADKGEQLLRQGRADEAKQAFERALKLSPADSSVRFRRGSC